jgi:hypothetical protein
MSSIVTPTSSPARTRDRGGDTGGSVADASRLEADDVRAGFVQSREARTVAYHSVVGEETEAINRMTDLSPELLEAAANRIMRASGVPSEDDYERQDAHDRLLYAVTASHYAAEAEPDEDDEDSWARLDEIAEHRKLTGEYLIDAGFTPERLPTRDDFELAAADATRMLNPPLGVIPALPLVEVAGLMEWVDAEEDDDDEDGNETAKWGASGRFCTRPTSTSSASRPGGRMVARCGARLGPT